MTKPRKPTPERKRPQSRVIQFLTQDEMKRVLAVIRNKRDRAMFLVAYATVSAPPKSGSSPEATST